MKILPVEPDRAVIVAKRTIRDRAVPTGQHGLVGHDDPSNLMIAAAALLSACSGPTRIPATTIPEHEHRSSTRATRA